MREGREHPFDVLMERYGMCDIHSDNYGVYCIFPNGAVVTFHGQTGYERWLH